MPGGVGGARTCAVSRHFHPVGTHWDTKKILSLQIRQKFKMANGKQSSDWTIIQNGGWACDWTRSQDGRGKNSHLIEQ